MYCDVHIARSPRRVPSLISLRQKQQAKHSVKSETRVLFISHDAYPFGAQILLLHLLRWLKRNTDLSFQMLLGDGGDLLNEFRALGSVQVWKWDVERTMGHGSRRSSAAALLNAAPFRQDARMRARRIRNLVEGYRASNVRLIYSNTSMNGPLLEALAPLHCPVISHIHEMGYWITHHNTAKNLSSVKRNTTQYISVSNAAKQSLVETAGLSESNVEVVHEFISVESQERHAASAVKIRAELGIPPDALIVCGSGTMDWRKGIDLFVPLALAVCRRLPNVPVHFVWVGGATSRAVIDGLVYDVERAGLANRVHFVGKQPQPLDFFTVCNVFVLPSREDPFPLVMLEAASLGKPIVCFENAGGAPEFVENDCGFVVPYLDISTMTEKVSTLLSSNELRHELGQRAARKVRERHSVDVAAPRIFELIEKLAL